MKALEKNIVLASFLSLVVVVTLNQQDFTNVCLVFMGQSKLVKQVILIRLVKHQRCLWSGLIVNSAVVKHQSETCHQIIFDTTSDKAYS